MTETISRLSIRRRLTGKVQGASRLFSGKRTFYGRSTRCTNGFKVFRALPGRGRIVAPSNASFRDGDGSDPARKRYEKIFFTRSSRYIYSNLFKFEFTAAVSAAAAHVPAMQSRFKYDFGRAKIPATSAFPRDKHLLMHIIQGSVKSPIPDAESLVIHCSRFD